MAKKITPVQRATAWRKEKMAEGYKQKSYLLSPVAQASIKKLGKAYGTERDAVEAVMTRAAKNVRRSDL